MLFESPQKRKITLTRPIWVKGKGLPKEGEQLFHEGEEVWAHSVNGAEWYIATSYKGREIKVAVVIGAL